MGAFRFKQFFLNHERSTLKIGTDAVLLAALTDVGDAHSILDVGCGCGVISFCLAQQFYLKKVNGFVVGLDTDASSIEEARDNVCTYPLLPANNFSFQHISIQAFAQRAEARKFDLIVSNPPYFSGDLKPQATARLKSKHSDGQLTFHELIECVKKLLHDNGRFTLILPRREGEIFDRLAAEQFHCFRRVFIQPSLKKPIARIVQSYSLSDSVPYQEHTFAIRDEQNQYTETYRQLTKDYLL